MTAGNATMAVWVAASFIMTLRFISFPSFSYVSLCLGSGLHTFEVSTYDASIISMLGRTWARSGGLMRLWPVVGLALAVFLSCRGLAQQVGPGAVTSVAVGDAACGQCHQDIFQKYLGTPMANASGHALDHAI